MKTDGNHAPIRDTEGSRSHPRRVAVLIAVLVVVAVIGTAIALLSRDTTPPLDDDLQPRKVALLPEHNALPLLEQSRERLSLSDEEQESVDRFLSSGEGDAELIAAILQRNQPALGALEEGLTRSGIDWDDPKEILERRDHVVWRKLALLQELESSFLMRGGDSKVAFDALFRILRFGQMLEGSGAMIPYLVGSSIKEKGLAAIRRMITNPTAPMNLQDLEGGFRRLDQYHVDPDALAEVFRTEYVGTLKLMEEHDDLPPNGYLFQPNNTKRLFAAHFRSYINNSTKHCSDMPRVESSATSGNLARFQMLLRPNSVGRIIYEIATPAYEKILFAKCGENDNLWLTRLFLTLKAYKDLNGDLPSSLSDLVPTYFEILPKSNHDGSPFHYSAAERTLSYFYFGGKGGDLKEEVLELAF